MCTLTSPPKTRRSTASSSTAQRLSGLSCAVKAFLTVHPDFDPAIDDLQVLIRRTDTEDRAGVLLRLQQAVDHEAVVDEQLGRLGLEADVGRVLLAQDTGVFGPPAPLATALRQADQLRPVISGPTLYRSRSRSRSCLRKPVATSVPAGSPRTRCGPCARQQVRSSCRPRSRNCRSSRPSRRRLTVGLSSVAMCTSAVSLCSSNLDEDPNRWRRELHGMNFLRQVLAHARTAVSNDWIVTEVAHAATECDVTQ